MYAMISEVAKHIEELRKIKEERDRLDSLIPEAVPYFDIYGLEEKVRIYKILGIDFNVGIGDLYCFNRNASMFWHCEVSNQVDENGECHSVNYDRPCLSIQFPTGPFIFSIYDNEYPRDFFEKFYIELIAGCKPTLRDDMNHHLVYEAKIAKTAYENYLKVHDKYDKLNKDRARNVRLERAKAEYEKALAEANESR